MSKVYGVLPETPAPLAPADLAADEVTAGYVSLSWTAADDATLYQVYRDGAPIGAPTVSTSFTDSTVVPSTAYSYQVQASNSAGSSALSSSVPATTLANSLPEWELIALSGFIGQAFALDMNAVCSDSDGHAVSYVLVSGAVPGLVRTGSIYAGTPTTAGVYPLTFRASDGYGTSDVTIDFTVTDPDVTAPTVPSNVSANVNGTTVTLSWTASTDASGVARYRVFRDGVFRASSTLSPYTEIGVPTGSYSYTVSAVDISANANESAQSSAAVAVIAPAAPDVPVNFTASGDGGTTINLSWSQGPSGSTPDDYDLDFSAVGASGPWTSIAFAGTGTSYAHTGRTVGTTYYYRIKADRGAVSSAYATASALMGSFKWNPGHYFIVNNYGSGEDTLAKRINYYNTMANESAIKGVCFRIRDWGELESTQGNYQIGFDLIDAELAVLRERGLRMILMLSPSAFVTQPTSPPSDLVPAYIKGTAYAQSGGYSGNQGGMVAGSTSWYANLRYQPVYERWIALVQALGARYDREPDIEAVLVTEESSVAQNADYPYPGGLSINAFRLATRVAWTAIGNAARAAWPTTIVQVMTNYCDGQLDDLFAAAETGRFGVGGPDVIPNPYVYPGGSLHTATEGDRVYQGQLGGNIPAKDYRGILFYCCQNQTPVYAGKEGAYLPAEIYAQAQTVFRQTHMIWARMGTPTNQTRFDRTDMTWAAYQAAVEWRSGIIPFLRTHATTVQTRPSALGD